MLDRGRSFTFAGTPQGLSLIEIRAYLDEEEITGDRRRQWVAWLLAMDAAYSRSVLESRKNKG